MDERKCHRLCIVSHNYILCSDSDKNQCSSVPTTRKRQSQSTPIAPKKKKTKMGMDEMDAVIVRNLEELCQNRRSSATDEDELFGKTIAATLHRFDLRKKLWPNYASKLYLWI